LDWVARSIHLNMRENFEATKNTNMAVRTWFVRISENYLHVVQFLN
jgi:hypothetical protein